MLTNGEKEFGDVVGVQRGALGGQAAGQVSQSDVRNLVVDIHFSWPCCRHIPSSLSSKINDHTTRFHAVYMLLQNTGYLSINYLAHKQVHCPNILNLEEVWI